MMQFCLFRSVLKSCNQRNLIGRNIRRNEHRILHRITIRNLCCFTASVKSSQSFGGTHGDLFKMFVRSSTGGKNTAQSKEDAPEYQHFDQLFRDIREYASENVDYFSERDKKNFIQSFQTILNVIEPLQISLGTITSCCHKFDVNENCKGNGYRSVINIVESCLQEILLTCQHIQKSREKLFFRSYHVYMELDSYTQVLSRLLTISNLAVVLLDYSQAGNLFPDEVVMDDMIADFEKINRECFYGRTFGFQYSDSIRQAMKVVAVAMAAYGDGYKQHNHSFTRALSSMLNSGKYMVNPELRAQRITELTQNANIDFCKAFWSVTEEYGVQHAPLLLGPAMGVNLEFEIPNKPLDVKTKNGDVITVEFPSLHSEHTGIKCRLLSYTWREGQNNSESADTGITSLGPKPSKKSRYLMLHCHGGGFVAQSSKSHEMYLRYWAKELQMPILSIDYSLSPAAPYPQAVNEVYFAYVWALNNLHKLGSTGEKICFSGDSAGANLVTSISLKAIQDNIRLPDSIVVAYPPYRLQFLPSPSRMLCLMDPLLPLGVLKSCIQAYTGICRREPPKQMDSFSYDGTLYNAYDLDFGNDPHHRHNDSRRSKLDRAHSYSEPQLNEIKAKFTGKPREDEEISFCSEFPYSETESSCYSDGQSQSLNDSSLEVEVQSLGTEGDLDELKQYTKPGGTSTNISKGGSSYERQKANASSVLSQFTSHVSSTVQGLTAGVADYFYGAEQNKQPDGMHQRNNHRRTATTTNHVQQQQIQQQQQQQLQPPQQQQQQQQQQQLQQKGGCKATPTAKKSTVVPPISLTRKRSLETHPQKQQQQKQQQQQQQQLEQLQKNVITVIDNDVTLEDDLNTESPCKPPKSKFSLCKICLEKTENCMCGVDASSPKVLRRRVDRHHKAHKHYQFSHHQDSSVSGRQRSATFCDADADVDEDEETKSTPCSPTTKNKQLSGLRLSLMSHPELSKQNSFNEHHRRSGDLIQSPNNTTGSPRVLYDRAAETCMILTADEEGSEYEMVDINTPVPNLKANRLYGIASEAFQYGKDPFMSPYLADDEMLRKLPPITIVACALDPLLDDSVEFVRKLYQLNNAVELYVLDRLPHGFLNFQPFSSEAREGCDLLIACIKKSLEMSTCRNDLTTSLNVNKKR